MVQGVLRLVVRDNMHLKMRNMGLTTMRLN